MRYLGNYKDWITDEMVDYFMRERGVGRPCEGKRPDSIEEELEYKRAMEAGYKLEDIYFYMFDKNNTPFDINPPFITDKFHWWVTKMLPGNFMPMHVDPHSLYKKRIANVIGYRFRIGNQDIFLCMKIKFSLIIKREICILMK